MTSRKLCLPTAVLTALALSMGACDGDKPEKSAPDKPAAAAKKVEKKDPATLISAKGPAVPDVYKGLKLGMTGADAKKLVPAMPEEDTIEDEGFDGMRFYTSFDDDTGRIQRFRFQLPKASALDMIKAKWGEPTEAEEYGKKVRWWFNAENGTRASLKESFGEELDVEYTAFVPVAQFLGEGPGLAFLKRGDLLGQNADFVRSTYALELREKSREEAAKDRKKIEQLSGKDLGVLGEPKPTMHLEFPPTEWGSYWTRVHLDFNKDNKIARVWFGLPYEPHPEARDQIFGLLKSKWGEPEEKEKYGRTRFHFANEFFSVEVEEDTITKKWDVFLEPRAG